MVKKIPRAALSIFLAAALSAACAIARVPVPQANKAQLTVSAAISLKDALEKARLAYITINSNVAIATTYGSSGTLELQIEQGASVDVFVSAAPKQMDDIQAKGLLLEGSRRDLFGNDVVLIVPKNSHLGIKSFQDLTRSDVKRVAIGEPNTVPAGEYAKEVLTKLGIYGAVSKKAVLGKDVLQVLTYVESGNVDAGVVYSTDAESAGDQVRVAAKAPPDSHAPVIYPGAVIKTSKTPDAAKKFLDFLASPQGSAIFESYGFTKLAR